MYRDLVKYAVFSMIIILLVNTMINVTGETSVKTIDCSTLSQLLINRLKDYKLIAPSQASDQISSLPGYPRANFKIIDYRIKNETPIYVFSAITIYGKTLFSYDNLRSKDKILLDDAVFHAFTDKYQEALEAFYHYAPSLAYGIPSGYYDVLRPVGIKELYIPGPSEIRFRLKPKLLLVLIGFSDGEWVKRPLYIYYFGFEAAGITFDGVYTRVTIVLSIVLDETQVLYTNILYNAGLVFYYSAHAVAPLSSSYPVTAIYGFIGILVALVITFIEYDEEYKYYVTLFILFVIQIFLYIALNVAAGISLDALYGAVIALGPWFVVLFVLWIAPYLFASYQYFSTAEESLSPSSSHYSAILEGMGLSIVVIMLALLVVFVRPVVEFLVMTSGPGGVYVLVVLLSVLDLFIGKNIGKLWAVFSRYHEAFTAPSYK